MEPEIVVCDANDTAMIRTGVRTKMDYMLDSPHFHDSLRLSCPRLVLHNRIEAVGGPLHEPVALLPESLESNDVPASGLEHPEAWRDSFTRFLSEQVTLESDSKAVVDLQRSYLKYPIYTDGATFALSFGKIPEEDKRAFASVFSYFVTGMWTTETETVLQKCDCLVKVASGFSSFRAYKR